MALSKQLKSTDETGTLRLVLYVRSLSPSECRTQQQTVVRRLDQLETDGIIDGYSVEVWGDQLAMSDIERTGMGKRIYDHVREVRTWADANGVSIDSVFPVDTVRSKISGEEYRRIRFPTMALVEYEDGEIRFFSPCTDGETVHTVVDRLDALEDSVGDQSTDRPREIGAHHEVGSPEGRP